MKDVQIDIYGGRRNENTVLSLEDAKDFQHKLYLITKEVTSMCGSLEATLCNDGIQNPEAYLVQIRFTLPVPGHKQASMVE